MGRTRWIVLPGSAKPPGIGPSLQDLLFTLLFVGTANREGETIPRPKTVKTANDWRNVKDESTKAYKYKPPSESKGDARAWALARFSLLGGKGWVRDGSDTVWKDDVLKEASSYYGDEFVLRNESEI